MIHVLISFLIGSMMLTGFQSHTFQSFSQSQQEKDDTLIWQVANRFSSSFNNGDASTMNKLLPDDFMLQWLHENFLEKKGLLVSMLDTPVHATLKHQLNHDSKSVIRYSDDYKSASLNTSFQFIRSFSDRGDSSSRRAVPTPISDSSTPRRRPPVS